MEGDRSRRSITAGLPDRHGDARPRLPSDRLNIRCGARARAQPALGTHLLGRGARRDRRPAARHPRPNTVPRRSRSAPAPAATTSAGCRVSATRSARPTGASRALPMLPSPRQHLHPDLGDFPVCDYTGDTPPAACCSGGIIRSIPDPDGETRFNVRKRWRTSRRSSSSIRARPTRRRRGLAAAPARHRRRAGAGDAQRHHRRGTV